MFIASFLSLVIVFILIITALLFIYPVKAAVAFNSEQQPDIYSMVSWLSPFLKVYVIRHDGNTTLKVNLFNTTILTKNLPVGKDGDFVPHKKSYMDYIKIIKSLKVNKARISASYGFIDPSITGMVFGAIDLVSQYVNPHEFFNNADFFTGTSYFNISASAEVNAGVSLIRMLKRNAPLRNARAVRSDR